MNQLSVESLIEEADSAQTVKAIHTSLLLTAWLGTLMLSRLPQIILSEMGVIAPSDWKPWWWIAMGVVLFALTYIWPAVKPLRSYFLMLTAIYIFSELLSVLQRTSLWTSWFGPQSSWFASFFGDRLGIVFMAVSLAMLLSLVGQNRREYFLAMGNVKAQATGLRLPWTVAGPTIAILLTAVSTAAILAMSPGIVLTVTGAISVLPAVLVLALMNAFGEELAYRAAPLSQLWQVVGKGQAIWMTALWFGVGHYYGGISFGAAGAVFFTLVAVLFGKAMLETKGLSLPVCMHLLGDVVLYLILASSAG